jgi:hypothetical protein
LIAAAMAEFEFIGFPQPQRRSSERVQP